MGALFLGTFQATKEQGEKAAYAQATVSEQASGTCAPPAAQLTARAAQIKMAAEQQERTNRAPLRSLCHSNVSSHSYRSAPPEALRALLVTRPDGRRGRVERGFTRIFVVVGVAPGVVDVVRVVVDSSLLSGS